MMILNAIPIVLLFVAIIVIGISAWLFIGWCLDRYNAYRTNNWKGW